MPIEVLHRPPGRSAHCCAQLQILLAGLLPLVLSLAVVARRDVGGVPGQGLGLIPISIASFLLPIFFAFQVLYDHIHHFIGLLIATFIAGLSLSAWITARRGRQDKHGQAMRSGRQWLLGRELELLISWLVLPWCRRCCTEARRKVRAVPL